MSGYLRQLQRSLSFIEAHLGGELRIQAIARHAGMSMWHFQRIFSAALGQPVMDYVRRRRLSRALEVLTGTRQPLIDIALDHGFGRRKPSRVPSKTCSVSRPACVVANAMSSCCRKPFRSSPQNPFSISTTDSP